MVIVDFLENASLKCWISERDVPPGHNYQETIVTALEEAKGVLFLFSEASATSNEITKELSIAGSLNLPVFPLRLAPIMPKGALRYELATRQWVDIFDNREQGLRKLVETIRNTFRQEGNESDPALRSTAAPETRRSVPVAAPEVKFTKAPIVAPGSQEFEAMRAMLARHIGPIAKIYVQKAATEARSQDDFFERLAAHINVPSDRTAFVQAARARLATKL
jgi:hypothetical protein